MFQQKPLVPQIMGNSFKDFTNFYQNLTKDISTKFKHTKYSKQYCDTHFQQKQIQTPVQNTWDSNHLDTFIGTNSWTQKTQYYDRNNLQNTEQKYKNTFINSQKRLQGALRESFFFTSSSRYIDDKNFSIKDYPDQYSDKNFLVSQRKDNDPSYFNKHFSISKHTDNNSMKLSMCKQPIQLMNPIQNLQELKNIKQEQKEFQKWKSEYKFMNKKYRVHKAGYPSGIIQVDNPCNFGSQLYDEEAKKGLEKQTRKANQKNLHQQHLGQLRSTNAQIEFFNSNSNKFQVRSENQLLTSQSNKFQHQYDNLNENKSNFSYHQREKMVPQWHSKSGIKENFINKWSDTNNRLFGAEAKEYSIKRAQYLREKETYNRNYNIMSYVDNKVEFKKDGGVKQ